MRSHAVDRWIGDPVSDPAVVLASRPPPDASAKSRALEVLRGHRAHFINYYGRFATEEHDLWRGPEPAISDLLRL